MNTIQSKTIGEMVADDFRTAQVFKNHNIDFCCKGNRSIMEAVEGKNIDIDKLISEIDAVQQQTTGNTPDYQSWPLDLLADYIEKTHHRYVAEQIPVLQQYLDKLCKVHGHKHPELFEISKHFNATALELTTHMKKEEQVLFPFIREMVKAKLSNQHIGQPAFGTVQNPVTVMMQEHENEGDRLRLIAALTNDYQAPADGCTTYRVAFSLLQEFEANLHVHIHLENNILFPKAVELEQELLVSATLS